LSLIKSDSGGAAAAENMNIIKGRARAAGGGRQKNAKSKNYTDSPTHTHVCQKLTQVAFKKNTLLQNILLVQKTLSTLGSGGGGGGDKNDKEK